jgi:hypothetical protein
MILEAAVVASRRCRKPSKLFAGHDSDTSKLISTPARYLQQVACIVKSYAIRIPVRFWRGIQAKAS